MQSSTMTPPEDDVTTTARLETDDTIFDNDKDTIFDNDKDDDDVTGVVLPPPG